MMPTIVAKVIGKGIHTVPRRVWRRLRGLQRTNYSPPIRPRDRGAPPNVDVESLRERYEASSLSQDKDDFVLYRIIGNDIIPRHVKGQSRRNLEFILEYEPKLPRCQKRWVVNRIVDPEEESTIIGILNEKKQPYIHIPFDWTEYKDVGWDLDWQQEDDLTYSEKFESMSKLQRARVMARIYRHKNNYVMNNNGARNMALTDGRNRAKWVLPWDGNCFLTAAAWSEILHDVTNAPWMKYHIVPMARISNNYTLIEENCRPSADEEPQVIFRSDAEENFDERHPYGRRPKVELLWRLGVPGAWDSWPIERWDLDCPSFAKEAGEYSNAGWVARLGSGVDHLEASARKAIEGRGAARNHGTVEMLRRLDERALSLDFDPKRLMIYDETRLNNLSEEYKHGGNDESRSLIQEITSYAEDALGRGPFSVIEKSTLPPSGNIHDYWHPAPYYWPHPYFPKILPYVFRDGQRVPGTRLYEAESDRYDRTRLQRVFDDTTFCALGWAVTGDRRFSEHGSKLVTNWFVNKDTKMNPHLEYAQVRWGHNKNKGTKSGIIEMKDLYFFLDAVRILEHSGSFGYNDSGLFKEWLKEYVDWLKYSEQGNKEKMSRNNHGTFYDLQVSAISAYLGDERELIKVWLRSAQRIRQQISESGYQTEEMERTQTKHYCFFNMQGWFNLTLIAGRSGQNLFQHGNLESSRLRAAVNWILQNDRNGWPFPQIEEFDSDRIAPFLAAYGSQCDHSFVMSEFEELKNQRQVLNPHYGVQPFWSLCFSRDDSLTSADQAGA